MFPGPPCGASAPQFSVKPEAPAVGENGNQTVTIRTQERRVVRVQAADDIFVRVPERVLVAGGNEGHRWRNRVQKGFGGRGSRSMMADLEDVGMNEMVVAENAKLHGPLQIACKQKAPGPVGDPEGEGVVVSEGRHRVVLRR